MPHTIRFLLLSSLAMGCGRVTEENFQERYYDAYCGTECTGDVSNTCDSIAAEGEETTDYGGCTFDEEAAKECVDSDNWSCQALIEDSEDEYPEPPAACDDVWDCGGQ